MSENSLFATFFIDDAFYGVPISQVQEVLVGQVMSRVHRAPVAVAGLINLRGRIVSVIDVRQVLRSGSAGVAGDAMNVVINADEDQVSLLVDRVGDVVVVDDARVEDAPATLRGVTRDFIRGVYAEGERLLLLLDTRRMLEDESCNQVPSA
jgi:purine-binding chemotaxis protein CheW